MEIKNKYFLYGLLFTLISLLNMNYSSAQQPLNQQAMSMLGTKNVTYPITFAVLGDPHVGNINDFTLGLEPMLNAMDIANVDFIIICGDLTSNGEDSHFDVFYENVSAWMSNTNIPIFCLPGNHDLYEGFSKYSDKIGIDLNYKFDFGHSRFMLLNNTIQQESLGLNDYLITDGTIVQVEGWMEEMPLNGFVFAHVPLYISSSGSLGIFGPEKNYDTLHNLIKQNNIRAFISGHDHSDFDHLYQHGTYEGVDYFVSCAPGQSMSSKHWLKYTVTECTSVSVEINWMDGRKYYEVVNGTANLKLNENLSYITETGKSTYAAENSLVASNDYSVEQNANIKFVSGNIIKLQSGFAAKNNSNFSCKICPDVIGSNKSGFISKNADSVSFENILIENKAKSLPEFQIYPNPNKGEFVIDCMNQEKVDNNVFIFNSLGNIVSKVLLNNGQTYINLCDQPDGIYLLKFTSSDIMIRQKIVINK